MAFGACVGERGPGLRYERGGPRSRRHGLPSRGRRVKKAPHMLSRGSICSCRHCARRFAERTGQPIPREKNRDDPLCREWIRWNYRRRLETWDLNNRVTQAVGGPDCLWIGRNSGSVASQCNSVRDYRGICRRTPIIMLDHQTRSEAGGFQDNGETALPLAPSERRVPPPSPTRGQRRCGVVPGQYGLLRSRPP
jgi:hypothetical protein